MIDVLERQKVTSSSLVSKKLSKKITLPRILVVDDDNIMQMIISSMLEKIGYDVITARDGQEAYDILLADGDSIDLILLDRIMPIMDGIELVIKLKQHEDLKPIPIVMQTGSTKPKEIKEGLDAGVFYYLTKPLKEEVLESVVRSALREVKYKKSLFNEMKKYKASFDLIYSSAFKCKTLEEAESVSCYIANCFPNPERILPGLLELMINAIEHGNLSIGYNKKTSLIDKEGWVDEVHRRLELKENIDKYIKILFVRREDRVSVRITDMGDGFDWRDYLEINPSRAMDNHGRGIARTNMACFDELSYNTKGNQVTASVLLG